MGVASVIEAVVALGENAGSIEDSGKALFNDIAHGIGGSAKINKVIGDLESILAVAKSVAADL